MPAGLFSAACEPSPDGARGVDVDGGRVYLTGGAGDGYLVILDATTPSSPSVLSVVPLTHTGNAVDVYSGFAFVATIAGTAGELVVVDL